MIRILFALIFALSVCGIVAYNPGTSWRNRDAFAALKTDGTVVAWGSSGSGGTAPSSELDNVQTIYSTESAFAALKTDGTVVSWGHSGTGGSSPAGLDSVVAIYSTRDAFAALKTDGTVVAWGDSNSGGTSPAGLDSVVAIYSTCCAFAALRNDHTVKAWGRSDNGGTSPTGLDSVVAIYSTDGAFAALKTDGTVVAWGGSGSGAGDITVSNVRTIYSTAYAFAALKTDGTVVAWGNSGYGGTTPAGLDNVHTIYSTYLAFAALMTDGTVVAWGDSFWGGTTPTGLKNVHTIYSIHGGFAALKTDGTVVSWGLSGNPYSTPGNIVSPAGLDSVVTIYSTNGAFAALKTDGTVVAWGSPYQGGVAPAGLDSVVAIYSTGGAFAALKTDGTVISWGFTSLYSNDAVVSPAGLDNVQTIFGSTLYRSFSSVPHSYVSCHAGTMSNGRFCEPCPSGVCICPAGKYGYALTLGAPTCMNCQQGKYSGSVGATSEDTCVWCDAGKYSLSLAATSAEDCVLCPFPTYSPPESPYCSAFGFGYEEEITWFLLAALVTLFLGSFFFVSDENNDFSGKMAVGLILYCSIPVLDSFTDIAFILTAPFASLGLFIACTAVFLLPNFTLFHLLWKRGALAPKLLVSVPEGWRLSYMKNADNIFKAIVNVLAFVINTCIYIPFVVLNAPYLTVKALVGMHLFNTKILCIRTFCNWWLQWWTGSEDFNINTAVDVDILNESIYMEIIFETLPETVIQAYNNYLFDPNVLAWNYISLASLSFAAIDVLNGIYVFIYFTLSGASLAEIPVNVSILGYELLVLKKDSTLSQTTKVSPAVHDVKEKELLAAVPGANQMLL